MNTTNPAVRLFGREPAAWVGLIEAVLVLVLAWVPFISGDQLVLVMAAVNAALGVYVAWVTHETALGAIVGLAKACVALGVGFGLALTDAQTAAILTVVSLVGSFFNRQQTFPVAYPPQPVPGAVPVSDVGPA